MRVFLWMALSLGVLIAHAVQAREMVITVDDLPWVEFAHGTR